jgi:YidC/Oxa1 family membrane protein insertase
LIGYKRRTAIYLYNQGFKVPMFGNQNSNTPQRKDQMHPEDLRNLLFFFALAGLFYLAYDTFILKPQSDALRAQHAQAQLIKAEGAGAALPKAAETFLERPAALAKTDQRVRFENAEITGSISLRGARLDDLSLRTYFEELEKVTPVSVLQPRGMKFFRTIDTGWITNDKAITVPDAETLWQVRGNDKLAPNAPVTLFWDNGQGQIFEQTFALDEHYMFSITQSVKNTAARPVTLYPYGLIAQRGMPPHFSGTWVSYEGPIGYIGAELFQKHYNDLRKQQKFTAQAEQGWIGITDKYWLTTLVPAQGEQAKYSFSFAGADAKDPEGKGIYQTDYLGAAREVGAGQSVSVTQKIYVGAKRVLLLKDYQEKLGIPKFDLSVDFGWFWFMTKPFFYALHYLGLWVGNMGVAIIILTIILRGAVFPLTNISYRSFAKMKKVGPSVMELRKNYGDDKQKLQQELIALYQREGVNPMSGCFPILLQIPIFFALYKTFFVTIELRHAPFFGWIQDLTAPDPTSIFNLFGLIPWDPPGFLMIGVWPCLMLSAMLLQKQLNPPPQDPIQRDMANYMPFMFAYMMGHFASGLVVYWTFSAYIGLLQQIIIMKSLGVPVHLFGETEDEKELNKEIEKGPAVHPLAEMAENEVESALFGSEDDKTPPPAKAVSKPKPKKSKKK